MGLTFPEIQLKKEGKPYGDQITFRIETPRNLADPVGNYPVCGYYFLGFSARRRHGIGARMDGIHVSTGFNKVGDYGKSPDDPDFRTGGTENSVWSGLLGPVSSWLLAIIFTVWLYRFKGPSLGALIVGALAVCNSLIRSLPMALALLSALIGSPYMEDEIGWGIWYVLKFYHPELASSALGFHALLKTYAFVFLASPSFWIPPLLSLVISLACLILAYRHNYKLWGDELISRVNRFLFGLLPFIVYFAAMPVLNWLDRLIRINW
jgi:hypothetical protein